MRRVLALTVLLTLAGCWAPEPPTWDAWLQTGTMEVDTTWVHVVDEEVDDEGSGTITTEIARYRLEGVVARDVSGYFLRSIREAGDEIAWAHCDIVIEGELAVDVDLAQRRPLQSQIEHKTTYSPGGSDPRVLSRSWREWTFVW